MTDTILVRLAGMFILTACCKTMAKVVPITVPLSSIDIYIYIYICMYIYIYIYISNSSKSNSNSNDNSIIIVVTIILVIIATITETILVSRHSTAEREGKPSFGFLAASG